MIIRHLTAAGKFVACNGKVAKKCLTTIITYG